ncbi:hypothetical protein RJ639_034161 [Escallonia herrerae]|uniref:SH3 domain-containing protein n=1 Tax=Escallonia herrerae TaxID=1293975 RepID=A0AA89B9E7_9ASTE|nr:hypothetical protein RJ639_034161 [Escallonia herrerae]
MTVDQWCPHVEPLLPQQHLTVAPSHCPWDVADVEPPAAASTPTLLCPPRWQRASWACHGLNQDGERKTRRLGYWQAILRQLGQEALMWNDAELQSYQELNTLYSSTRAAKHFQRDIVRNVEGYISATKKQMEIVRKLAEDCRMYGTENQSDGSPLARAALHFGASRGTLVAEKETLVGILSEKVSEPLRASITGAPLEDARHLTRRCERLRHEVEVQAAEVMRRQSKCNDPFAESAMKLKNAEAKLMELRSSLVALERETTDAMSDVEDLQQRTTFQRLLAMVDAERSFHRNSIAVLEDLHSKIILEMQVSDSSLQSATSERDVHVPPVHEDITSVVSDGQRSGTWSDNYAVAKVRPSKSLIIHSFDAQADGELSLAVDDYVVVRQVASNGWSEGERMGKAGWFPSAYVEIQEKAPGSKNSF